MSQKEKQKYKVPDRNNSYRTSIGGQALIEGVMMRGVDKASMAVRLSSGEIDVETWSVQSTKDRKWYQKVPIVRGVFNFVSSMVLGYKCLMKSAEKMELDDGEEEEKPGKFEQKILDLFGDNLMKVVTVVGMVIGVAVAVLLFMYLPALIAKGVNTLTVNFLSTELGWFRTLIEGIIKIALFVGYLAIVACMKDVRRTFEYHGAEHKSIACYEGGEELTVENVRQYSRFHPRCGTSFLIIVLIISIIVFSVVTWDNLFIRLALKIVLLPVVVGIAYELIKIAGRHDNVFTRILSAPGLALQRLTTREPDDEEIETGIAALKAVLPDNKGDDQW